MKERWLPLVGCPGYEVSENGKIRSLDRVITVVRSCPKSKNIITITRRLKGRERKLQRDDPSSYPFIMADLETKVYCHRAVLEAFVGPCPDGMQCLHEDDDKNNPKLGNLSWGTPSKNITDAYKTGRRTPIKGTDIATKAWITKRKRAAERAARELYLLTRP